MQRNAPQKCRGDKGTLTSAQKKNCNREKNSPAQVPELPVLKVLSLLTLLKLNAQISSVPTWALQSPLEKIPQYLSHTVRRDR